MTPHHYYLKYGECRVIDAGFLIKQTYRFFYEYDNERVVYIDREFIAIGFGDLYIIKRENWENMRHLGIDKIIEIVSL